MLKNRITILIASLLIFNAHVKAGFFDNLADNLKSGDLGALVTDVVKDVAKEVEQGSESPGISPDVFTDLFDDSMDSIKVKDELTASKKETTVNISNKSERIVEASRLSKKSSFFGSDDDRVYLDGKDDPFTGTSTNIYSDGKTRETQYKNGVKHGVDKWWHKNGNISQIINWEGGLHHGNFDMWYENGNKKSERYALLGNEAYLEGKPVIYWYENGNKKQEYFPKPAKGEPFTDRKWYKNGGKKKDMVWRSTKGDPVLINEWHSNGIKKLEVVGISRGGAIGSVEIRDSGYLLAKDEKGKMEKYVTSNTLSINQGKNTCLFEYLKKPLSEGFDAYKKSIPLSTAISKDGDYSIESYNLYERCIPRAYQACQDDNNKECDKMFMQGAYSAESIRQEKILQLEDKLFKKRSKNLREKNAKAWDKFGIKKPNILKLEDVRMVNEGDKSRTYYGNSPYTGFIVRWFDRDSAATDITFQVAAGDSRFNPKYLKVPDSFISEVWEVKDGYNLAVYNFHPNRRPSSYLEFENGLVYNKKRWDAFGYLTMEYIFKGGKPVELRRYDSNGDQAILVGHELYPDTGLPFLTDVHDIYNKNWLDTLKKVYINGAQKLSLKEVAPIKEMQRHGLVKKYWPNGKLLNEAEYVNGNKHGYVTFYDPIKIDSETNKQEVVSTLRYVDGEYQASDDIFTLTLDYDRQMKALIRQYDDGGDSLIESIEKTFKNDVVVDMNVELDGKKGVVNLWGDKSNRLGLKESMKSWFKVMPVQTDLNTAQCVTSFMHQPDGNLYYPHTILVHINADVTNDNNIDYVSTKCQEAKVKYYSDQYVKQNSCRGGVNVDVLKDYTLDGVGLYDLYISNPIEACEGEQLVSEDKLKDVSILDVSGSLIPELISYATGYDFNIFLQSKGCVSNKDEICYDRIYKNPSSISNKYLDMTKWMELPDDKVR